MTRLGKTNLLQGASQIVLRGLPATIDPASIRVEGKGDGTFSVGAVDVRITPGDAKPVLDTVLEEKLRTLRDEKETVSYTHLDVYKRQRRRCIDRHGRNRHRPEHADRVHALERFQL